MFQWFRQHISLVKLGCAVLIGLIIWFCPKPQDLAPEGWKIFAIFTATVVAIILRPLPMGAVSVLALTFAIVVKGVTLSTACSGFGNEVVWLVVFAFFIAKGFISTGLGNRLAFFVMKNVGKNSLGLGYGLVATDLILSPCIPSVTARAGGVVYPILRSLADLFTGASHDPKMATFLSLCAYQGTAVSSALFLTAMAGNPLVASIAQAHGVTIGWMDWALAAIVPGIVSLALMPYLIYRLNPPFIRTTPHAKEMAEKKLLDMGPMSFQEKIMGGTFCLLILLWVSGHLIGIGATSAAMIGVSILLLTGILKWKDILQEYNAWDTLIWFATLVTLACQLNQSGFSTWFGETVGSNVEGMHWGWGFLLLALIYYYSHYFFASAVAHIGSMFAPLLLVAFAIGTPPKLAVYLLAFFSSLFTGLTHYGSGAAPILFGTGYTTVSQWWKTGALCSFLYIFIWMLLGGIWWKILGIW